MSWRLHPKVQIFKRNITNMRNLHTEFFSIFVYGDSGHSLARVTNSKASGQLDHRGKKVPTRGPTVSRKSKDRG